MSTTTKYKLDDFAETDESILIGIISSAPDYTVCWHLNKQLQINLTRCDDIKFDFLQKNKKVIAPDLFSLEEQADKTPLNCSEHHLFKFIDEQLFSEYYFIVNKGTQINLEPQLKRVTYFFELNGVITENSEQIVFDLNAIEPIEMAYIIGKESLINKLQLLV
jgi:hypothetical protein